MSGLLKNKYDERNRKVLRNLKFRKLKTWQLLVALVPLLVLSAVFLRLDHIRVNEMIEQVAAADESGDTDELAATLTELRNFTFTHIIVNVFEKNGNNFVEFGTGPIYLQNQYTRTAEAAIAEAEKNMPSDKNPYGNIFQQASDTCKARAKQYGWHNYRSPEYIGCMTSEIDKYPAADELQSVISASIPSTALYLKEYASPIWAPCLSGWVILFAIIIMVIIIFRFLVWLFFRLAIFFL